MRRRWMVGLIGLWLAACGDADSVGGSGFDTTDTGSTGSADDVADTLPPLDDTTSGMDGDDGPECTLANSSVCDDDDPCTADDCFDNACRNTAEPNGTPCLSFDGRGGTCQAGMCTVGCTADLDCDDANACTTDTCNRNIGQCEFDELSGVSAPASEQTPGDCSVVVCMAGVTATSIDNADLPDDGNDCTTDQCIAGVPTHNPFPAGTGCGIDDGLCDGRGSCGECLSPADCTDLPADNDCQTRTCIAGACGQTFAPAGTPLNATLQTTGNCQEMQCNGAGGFQSVADDDDLPVDGLECTNDVCNQGLPFNPNLPSGTSCSAGVCNASGTCIGCNTPADCGGTNTFCQTITCIANVCGVDNTVGGIPLPSGLQVVNDCQQLQCDGNGQTQSVPDPTDLPLDDGNVCTSETCGNGLPQHPPLPPGSTCSDGLFCTLVDECDGAGVCLGTGNPCPGPDGDGNCAESCNEVTNTCNGNDPQGSACNDTLFCNGADTCDGNGGCTVHAGSPCAINPNNNDCTETCIEANDSCDGTNPIGTPCNDGLFCTMTSSCTAAGTCVGSGNPCPGPDGDGNCAESCNEASDNCTAADPNNSVCNDGNLCNGTDQCSGGACSIHSGNPCLPLNTTNNDCSESCNPANGQCTANDPIGTGCNDGLFCTTTSSCNANGVCVGSGNPCAAFIGNNNCDCTESCNEASDNCTAEDPNGSNCQGNFPGVCENGICLDLSCL